MKRICYTKGILTVAMAAILALGIVSVVAAATPNPNSAVLLERVFNDCPASALTSLNNYPAEVSFDDIGSNCFGYANLHCWRFSEDGSTPAAFENGSSFEFSADLVVTGDGEGEAGLQVRPWWSESDGRFNCRTTDGEIACFGGRLPFYSFTASDGLHYVKGDTIHLAINYQPHCLTSGCPAEITYSLVYGGTSYSSGPLAFDEGNPAEDPPHGLWGMLTPAYVGGHDQVLWQTGGPGSELHVQWLNITFAEQPVPTEPTTWGKVKTLYN
jgi:hypothetical protein